jgi:hypothetical protein
MTRASLHGVLLDPAKGILYFSPLFALAFIAAIAATFRSSRRGLAVLCLAVTLWMVVYASSLVNWDAGWTVGPRYMTVIAPFALFSLGLAWAALGPRAKAALLPIGVGLGIASVVLMTPTSVLFPHLPPAYKNPVFELIAPLWRDGITPHNLASDLLGWTGRSAQAPFVFILGAILLYLVWIASGASLNPRPAAPRRALSSAIAVLIAISFVYTASIPRTARKLDIDPVTSWVRTSIWEPRLDPPKGADPVYRGSSQKQRPAARP